MNIHSHVMVMTQFVININDDRRMKIDISLLINDLPAKCCRAAVQNAGHAKSLQYSWELSFHGIYCRSVIEHGGV